MSASKRDPGSNALVKAAVIDFETPQGRGTIETYTVVHKREGPFLGIVVGRDADGRRFVANTPHDPGILAAMEASEQIGRTGTVTQAGQLNIFTPD